MGFLFKRREGDEDSREDDPASEDPPVPALRIVSVASLCVQQEPAATTVPSPKRNAIKSEDDDFTVEFEPEAEASQPEASDVCTSVRNNLEKNSLKFGELTYFVERILRSERYKLKFERSPSTFIYPQRSCVPKIIRLQVGPWK
jgi:hypothetical protein